MVICQPQLNRASALSMHKDKKKHGLSWLITFGDFDGGRFWLEGPLGSQNPHRSAHMIGKKFEGDLPQFEEQMVPVQPCEVPCGRRSDAWGSKFHYVVVAEVLDKDSAELWDKDSTEVLGRDSAEFFERTCKTGVLPAKACNLNATSGPDRPKRSR